VVEQAQEDRNTSLELIKKSPLGTLTVLNLGAAPRRPPGPYPACSRLKYPTIHPAVLAL
jgi:hypothetical protein